MRAWLKEYWIVLALGAFAVVTLTAAMLDN